MTGSDPVPGCPELELGTVLRDVTALLAGAGVPSPRTDCELLAAQVLRLSRGELVAEALRGRQLSAAEAAALAEVAAAREQRVPLQHLTGRAPFRGLDLRVGPGVFVPRPETELLAGLAVAEAARLGTQARPAGMPAPLVVDLCTGSGAIALAVATEVPEVLVVGVELDPPALAWAWQNRSGLPPAVADRVELRAGDAVDADTGVLSDLAGRVDLVVANPPYIPPGAVPVDPEVAGHDPPLALYGGGEDGLDVLRGVVRAATGLLGPGGLFLLEHAEGQGRVTRALASAPHWTGARTEDDLTGRPRALVARRAGAVVPGEGGTLQS